jgi:hypothetical protein
MTCRKVATLQGELDLDISKEQKEENSGRRGVIDRIRSPGRGLSIHETAWGGTVGRHMVPVPKCLEHVGAK